MRYILNFNAAAVALLGSAVTNLDVVSKTNKTFGATTALVPSTDGVAYSPLDSTEGRFKVRLSASAARTAGLRGSQRYTIRQGRGKNPSFFLVPHSQVRRGKRLVIDGPAVTVSITERAA